MGNRAANPPTNTPRFLAAIGCGLVGLVLFQFFGNAVRGYVNSPSLFWWWVSQWLDPRAEAEHGWIVLAVSVGLLAWNRRRGRSLLAGIARDERRSHDGTEVDRVQAGSDMRSVAAFAAMLAGLALHLIGFVAQQTRLSIIAFLVFTWGVLRLGGGGKWGEAAAFPLAFMVFAIPVNVLDSVGFWLQMGVVKATAALAHVATIDVVRNGTQLFAPDGRYQYDVVAACSGVRSLVALCALSVLIGYISFRGWRRRALVLLLCFPFVYLGNVVRLVAIVLAAEIGGQNAGDAAHHVMGFGVFAIVLGGVMAVARAIERWWPEGARRAPTDDGGPTAEAGRQVEPAVPSGLAATPTKTRRADAVAALTVAATIAALAVAEMFFLHHLATSPARGGAGVALSAEGNDPVELPAFLGTEWIGRRAEITAIEREILPADTGFSRKVYVSLADPTRQVLLSIVLSGRDRTSIHRPELCLVGQGWTIAGEEAVRFRDPHGREFPATRLRVQREVVTPRGATVVPSVVVYWFVNPDRVVATHWERVALDGWNRVRHGRADRWAYVLMQTDASDGEAAALTRLQTVLDGTLGTFQPIGAR